MVQGRVFQLTVCEFALAQSRCRFNADDDVKSQPVNVLVAVRRPHRLLALAMHANRASEERQKKLMARGWQVLDWTVSLAAPAIPFVRPTALTWP